MPTSTCLRPCAAAFVRPSPSARRSTRFNFVPYAHVREQPTECAQALIHVAFDGACPMRSRMRLPSRNTLATAIAAATLASPAFTATVTAAFA
jgi:hypothetical protein